MEGKQPEEPRESPPPVAPSHARSGRPERLLLVEDDESLRTVLARGLTAHGYSVVAAEGASEALEAFHAVDGDVQLLITDVVLPGLDGPDLAAELTAQRPGLPVLYISGYPRETLTGLPADAELVVKPIGFEALARRARQVLDGARTEG